MKLYLASPLGFAESTRWFMGEVESVVGVHGVEVVNPWRYDATLGESVARAERARSRERRLILLQAINTEIAERNEKAIRGCDLMVAVLDGVDVDSGTASEVGFAYGLKKRIIGLRTDFRLSGDNEAALINVQVRYWIETSGGSIVRSLRELGSLVGEFASAEPGTRPLGCS
jgi:nucleoside 2-deoxyribosyltransferase